MEAYCNFTFHANGFASLKRSLNQEWYTIKISCVLMEAYNRWKSKGSKKCVYQWVPLFGKPCIQGIIFIRRIETSSVSKMVSAARFGGGPACNRLFRCPMCHQKQEVMDKRWGDLHSHYVMLQTVETVHSLLPLRRREELDTFLDLQRDFQNEKSSVPIYAIAMNWFRKWENFVKNRNSSLPGPVENLPITILRNGNRVLRPCKFMFKFIIV